MPRFSEIESGNQRGKVFTIDCIVLELLLTWQPESVDSMSISPSMNSPPPAIFLIFNISGNFRSKRPQKVPKRAESTNGMQPGKQRGGTRDKDYLPKIVRRAEKMSIFG